MVKVNPNPGVNALEFGVKCNLDYEVITKNKEVKNYANLPTAGDSIAEGLDVAMTVKSSTVEPGLTWMTYAAADSDEMLENFVMLLVKVPEDAKSGDTYAIDYAEVGAGGASKNIFQVKEKGLTTDYVELNDFSGSDGFIKIEGETTVETTTTTIETATETTTTETTTTETTSTTTAITSKSTTSNITTAATNSTTQKPITTTNQNTTSSKVNMTTSNTNSSSTTTTTNKNGASPKTGGSDVLPIAGAGAAVAVLGGIALVAKKKN